MVFQRMLVKQNGVSIIELVITIVIVSIALLALFVTTSRTTERSVDPMIEEQAIAIADAYFEEIIGKDFCDPDWDKDGLPSTALDCPNDCGGSVCDTGACRVAAQGSSQEGSRDLYDDICDYDPVNDNPPVDSTNNSLTELNQYTVTVDIIDDGGGDINLLSASAGQSARIDVTVSHPALPSDITISGFKTNF
jgi:MSHA pilin protein MshD